MISRHIWKKIFRVLCCCTTLRTWQKLCSKYQHPIIRFHLKPTAVATRRHETHYIQIRCNSCMYSQTFFPSAFRLWNSLPPDIYFLLPDSFYSELSKISLIWPSFISLHRTILLPDVNIFTLYEIPQHMISSRSAIIIIIKTNLACRKPKLQGQVTK